MDKSWKPDPGARSGASWSDYHAGYSDGFYGAKFGAGHAKPNADYRAGFNDASTPSKDRNP